LAYSQPFGFLIGFFFSFPSEVKVQSFIQKLDGWKRLTHFPKETGELFCLTLETNLQPTNSQGTRNIVLVIT
jgi:hypothetical protein